MAILDISVKQIKKSYGPDSFCSEPRVNIVVYI